MRIIFNLKKKEFRYYTFLFMNLLPVFLFFKKGKDITRFNQVWRNFCACASFFFAPALLSDNLAEKTTVNNFAI
jgi:hypothetical protein